MSTLVTDHNDMHMGGRTTRNHEKINIYSNLSMNGISTILVKTKVGANKCFNWPSLKKEKVIIAKVVYATVVNNNPMWAHFFPLSRFLIKGK